MKKFTIIYSIFLGLAAIYFATKVLSISENIKKNNGYIEKIKEEVLLIRQQNIEIQTKLDEFSIKFINILSTQEQEITGIKEYIYSLRKNNQVMDATGSDIKVAPNENLSNDNLVKLSHGIELYQKKQYFESQKILEDLYVNDPNHKLIKIYLAASLYAMSPLQERIYPRILELIKDISPSDDAFQIGLETRTQILGQQSRWLELLSNIPNEIIIKYRDSKSFLLLKLQALYALGQYSMITKNTLNYPIDTQSAIIWCNSLAKQGEWQTLVQFLNSDNFLAETDRAKYLGMAYYIKGNLLLAKKYYGISAEKGDISSTQLLAEVLFAKNEFKELIQLLRSTGDWPTQSETALKLQILKLKSLIKLGRIKEADKLQDKLLTNFPTYKKYIKEQIKPKSSGVS